MSRLDFILRNIIGFTRGEVRFDSNDQWHFLKHCLMPWGDLTGVLTIREYLEMAREVGRKAASRLPGTYVRERVNGEIAVYWEPAPGRPGLFMVVAPCAAGGEVKTLFRPRRGKAQFDEDDPVGRRGLLH
jgi:hypothetical protein